MHVFREICAISIISKCNRFISKKVMTIKITVLLPIFVPPSLFNRKWYLVIKYGCDVSVSYRFISNNRVYFGIVSVSDRFGLGTVDEYGFRNLVFISIYNVRIGFTSIYEEKSVLFRYHG